MAYYEGETLKERIERGPLRLDEAVDITTQELVFSCRNNSYSDMLTHAEVADIDHLERRGTNDPTSVAARGIDRATGWSSAPT